LTQVQILGEHSDVNELLTKEVINGRTSVTKNNYVFEFRSKHAWIIQFTQASSASHGEARPEAQVVDFPNNVVSLKHCN